LVEIEEKYTMQRNKPKSAAAFSSAFAVAVLAVPAAIVSQAAAAQLQEHPAEIADLSGAAMSSTASNALRHITLARRNLESRNFDAADQALGKALGLLDLAQSTFPVNRSRTENKIPLGATRRLITEAREELHRKDIVAVDAALKAAEDNVAWLEQAAHAGNSEAQQDLGQLYAHGWGVEKDPIWAYV
jgi:TPR repeat protein